MLPDRLKAWRDKAGLNQTDAAKLLGMSRMTYCRYEAGARAIPDEVADKCKPLDGEPEAAKPVPEEIAEAEFEPIARREPVVVIEPAIEHVRAEHRFRAVFDKVQFGPTRSGPRLKAR